MNCESTACAIHSFYFPLYIFHTISFSLLQILLQIYDQTICLPIQQLIIFYTLLQIGEYLCPVDINYEISDIKDTANKVWTAIGDKKVIAFHGHMGAGKTTFIHALCEIKGVKDVVSSPTFSIINEYSFPGGMIYHIDLYRLKDEEEAIRAGVEDCLYSDHVCFVEWPEKAPAIFPPDTVHVLIEVINSDSRHLTVRDK